MKALDKFFPYLLLYIAFSSAPGFFFFGTIYNETIHWCVYVLMSYILYRRYKTISPKNNNIILHLYLLWLGINVVRGALFVAEDYWAYKALIKYSFALAIPFCAYIYAEPYYLRHDLMKWLKYAYVCFPIVTIYIWSDSYYFFYALSFMAILFYPYLPRKWRYILVATVIFILLRDMTARASVVKSFVTLVFLGFYHLKNTLIKKKVLNMLLTTFFVAPIILLILGISGTFNVFRLEESLSSAQIEQAKSIDQGFLDDSRTFIYENVIISSVEGGYFVWGRTPAKGNDDAINAEKLGFMSFVRDYNEVGHPNVFTWLGLIGLVLMSTLYFQAAYRAINNSNNIVLKMTGVCVAFHWFFGWVEDTYAFNMMTITNWIMIGVCLSPKFRAMTEYDMQLFVWGMFNRQKKHTNDTHNHRS